MSDRQMTSCRRTPAQIAKKIAANKPVTLKELAIHLEVGYGSIRNESKLAGFPFWTRHMVFPNDYQLWRQQRLGLLSWQQNPERPSVPTAGKRG